jgi:hypothetical protein
MDGLRRIFVNSHVFGDRHDLASGIVAAGRADVMRSLQFAAIAAILWVSSHQSIMRTTHVALGTGDSVLRDSHVSTSICWGTGP